MIIKIPTHGLLSESEAAKIALDKYLETFEEDREVYSPAIKAIGKYYVNYRFGEDPYIVYVFETFEDIQINHIEIEGV